VTPEGSARTLSRPGLGVVRHADAGYPEAIRFAREYGIRLRR